MSVRCSGILAVMVDQPEAKRRRLLRRHEKDVRAVLSAWDPIPGSPEDEYDCLISPSIKRLDAGVERDDLVDWLTDEVRGHRGLAASRDETRPVAQRLLDLWAARP
jgi:hypothetical protein